MPLLTGSWYEVTIQLICSTIRSLLLLRLLSAIDTIDQYGVFNK